MVSGHCRHCGIYQKDLFGHLKQSPAHRSDNPKDRSNYRAYHRGKEYREGKHKYQKKRYKKKHPKKMKLSQFF